MPGPYITAADIQARVPAGTFALVFDREASGDAPSIAAFVAVCIAEAQSEWDMRVGSAFPGAFDENGALVDENIKGRLVAIALYVAVRYSPLATADGKSAYRQAYMDGLKFLDQLRTDNGARVVTSAGGLAAPRALDYVDAGAVEGSVSCCDTPFARAARSCGGSGF